MLRDLGLVSGGKSIAEGAVCGSAAGPLTVSVLEIEDVSSSSSRGSDVTSHMLPRLLVCVVEVCGLDCEAAERIDGVMVTSKSTVLSNGCSRLAELALFRSSCNLSSMAFVNCGKRASRLMLSPAKPDA